MNPLRLGLLIMLAILVIGLFLYSIWPARYRIAIHESAEVAAAMPGLPPGDFWSETRDGKLSAMLVDVRSKADYDKGHIKGAIHIPFGQLTDRKQLHKLRKEQVYLYSESEAVSHQAALLLRMLGINATPVNSTYPFLTSIQFETENQTGFFFSEEKMRFNYPLYFKAFKVTEPAPVEIKVPVPKPEGC